MNKAFKIMFTAILLLSAANIAAQQQVSIAEATAAAKQEITVKSYTRALSTTSSPAVYKVNSKKDSRNNTSMYEVVFADGQAVLLSGSKACLPVLGTYTKSDVNESVFDEDMPCGLKALLGIYQEQIDSSFTDSNMPLYYANEWAQLQLPATQSQLRAAAANNKVDPLLTSQWNQSFSNDTYQGDPKNDAYNYYCPSNNCDYSTKSSAGCVAVAMAQVMYYWQYPVYSPALGNQQFDWCNMVDELRYKNNSNYETERNAVAWLIRKCGEAVGMDYGCSSSASTEDVDDVLVKQFGFHDDADYKRNNWFNYSDKDWKNKIKSNLNNGCPVIYRSGGDDFFDFGGHAWVCDGYDGDRFHMNWGWGWRGNLDDWFTLDNLNPVGASQQYKNWHAAVFDIYPAGAQDHCNFTFPLSIHFMIGGSQQNLPRTFTVLESMPIQQPATWRTISPGETAEYIAHNEVILKPGFEAKAGSNFTARIEPCKNCGSSFRRTGINQFSKEYNEIEYLSTDNNNDKSTNEIMLETSEVKVFPNPTNDVLYVQMNKPEYISDLRLYSLNGNLLYQNAVAKSQEIIDMQAYPVGVYVLKIQDKTGKNEFVKIIRGLK